MASTDYVILIHKQLTGVISKDEQKLLEEWLDQDPLHRSNFEEIRTLWELSEADEGEGEPDLTVNELQEDLAKLDRAIADSRQRVQLIERLKRKNGFKNIMIGGLLLIAVVLSIWTVSRGPLDSTFEAGTVGERELILADDSRVLLNDSTRLTFRMNFREREAELTGEAYFEVKADKRPFRIRARGLTATVLGTSFIVKAYAHSTPEIIVIEGNVKVSDEKTQILVGAGEKAFMMPERGISKSKISDPNFNTWYTGELEFNKTELREVLSLIGKQYHASFKIDDEGILRCRFTGKFNNATLEEVLKTLSFSLDIEFVPRTGNHYEVSGKGCT